MTHRLAFLILLVLFPALYLAFTLGGRIDDGAVQLDAAATSRDRLPSDFSAFVAGLHDRTPPNHVTTTTEAQKPKARTAPKQSTPPWRSWTWDDLCECECGGNWACNTGNGYSGGLQMDATFWESYGGLEFAPEPWMATREQQIVVAERGLAAQGPGAWPVCSYKVGMR